METVWVIWLIDNRELYTQTMCFHTQTDRVLVGASYTKLQCHLHRVRWHCHEYESERAAPSPAVCKASTKQT